MSEILLRAILLDDGLISHSRKGICKDLIKKIRSILEEGMDILVATKTSEVGLMISMLYISKQLKIRVCTL